MTNAAIAAELTKIGKILELKGENVFRVRAYDRAGQTILSLTEDLADIHARGGIKGLKEIPGIGADLAQKIEELLQTGKLAYLDELQKEVPAGVVELMEIPGLGPKKAKLVWEKFKVTDVASLKTLLDSGKLEEEKGWGEKSVAKIKEGIADKESLGSRMPLHTALLLGESLKRMLEATKLCGRIELAGSLRRRKETIGDIDILVTGDAEKVMDAFCAFSGVKKVIGRGPTKVSVLLDNGIQSDLRVLPDEVFGAALHYFTGSKQHNVKVRGMALKNGVTINEYGVFKGTAADKGDLVAGRTEEEVFRAAGIPAYIPPELREDRGEIEAALSQALPELLEVADIKGDLHMHSTYSDGAHSMEVMAQEAKKRGLDYIAITDHASPMGMVRGIKPDNIDEYLKVVDEARKAVKGIHILAGAEVDIMADGSLFLPDSVLKKLDWVVVSVHGHFKQTREEMTARILKALENPYVHLFAHPTTRLLLKRPGIEFDTTAVFSAAVKHGVALELNASSERLDLDDVHCKRAKELGARLCIDSDAHHPKDMDYVAGVAQARRGWLTKDDVLNTLPWKAFEKLLQKQ